MSELEDVVRWSADPDAPAGLGELVRAANVADTGPTPAELKRLRGKLAPQLGMKAALSLRAIFVGMLVVGIGAALVVSHGSRSEQVAPRPTPPPILQIAPPPPPATAPPPAPAPPASIAPPTTPSFVEPARPHVRPAPKPPVVPAPEPAPLPAPAISEVALLEQARAAVRGGDAAHALALIEQDAALYPDGVLVEEREALAIEALIKLARRDEAAAKWSRFATAYPRSNYRARLQRLLDDSSVP